MKGERGSKKVLEGMRLRACLSELREYVPGKTVRGAVKLSSNENPLGASPRVVERIASMLKSGDLDISKYPWSEREEALREEISAFLHRFHGVSVPTENIVLGAGSDGILDTLTRLLLERDCEALIPIPTFSLYETLVLLAGGVPRFVHRSAADFSVPPEILLELLERNKTKMLFLCSPNNPTGNAVTKEEMRCIADACDAVVVVDEAYAEFASHSFLEEALNRENVVVTRTFSKAFGLAGLRIGYAILPDWLVTAFRKASLPFSVNSVALEAAILALQDEEHLRRTVELVRKEREFLRKHLSKTFKVFPSEANFLLVDVSPLKAKAVCDALAAKGVLVRDCSSFRGAGDSLVRITVGEREQNEKLLAAMQDVVAEV
ncbi:MAG: histidinol-phosphate transaminase [Candidatus Methanospirare jalkutatii]|nr:MAG: histidinol-phosphate transaminase [Candidatus Methanospirare jalkutatii]